MWPDPDEDEANAEEGGGQSEADMIAEWEAMAAEGDEALEGDETAQGAEPAAASASMEGDQRLAIHDVDLDAYAILGRSSMPVSQLLRMGRGAVVELDQGVGDKVEIRVNDHLVARGEIVVVEDKIAVEITEVVARDVE